MITRESPVSALKGVGDMLAQKLSLLGVTNVETLIHYYPRRYDDYSHVQTVNALKPGTVSIKAFIKQARGKYVRRGMHITEAVASDETGSVRLVWFNQPYRAQSLQTDSEYFVSGEFGLHRQRLSIQNPSIELASSFPVNTARIVPIYRETKGLKSYQIRKLVRDVMPLMQNYPETLPALLIKKHKLVSYSSAIVALHFPKDANDLKEAKRRLGFEEVFGLSLASLLNKYQLLKETALEIPFNQVLAKAFVSNLPFKLTDAQRKVVWQIYKDMEKSQPMNRLIEGDVGSGKTVVATMAALMAMEHDFQAALMAPTELLAKQHAASIYNLLEPVGMAPKLSLLVGSMTANQKQKAYQAIKDGSIGFIVGTHALIQEKVDMHRLGLVIVDEQHRFGVDQRKKLQAKAGHMPHVLALSATPIPRSLALTLFGELDISLIDTKPLGRLPINTAIISPNSRKQLNEKIEKELKAGRQSFFVTPLITDSNAMDATSAEKLHKQLVNEYKHWRIGLLHGRMKAKEKDDVMRDFVEHNIDILVATTVIEVGVDVPNATVMVIENAERFGLAQIHQLRGRVGRSQHQGYCYLVLGDSQPPSRRLLALEQTNNGFELAELDLKIRGPGAIYGTMQHGQLDLRIAELSDTALIAEARKAAQEFIDSKEDLLEYKKLYDRVQKLRAVTNLN